MNEVVAGHVQLNWNPNDSCCWQVSRFISSLKYHKRELEKKDGIDPWSTNLGLLMEAAATNWYPSSNANIS